MSKIKYFIHKVASATSSSRDSLNNTADDETGDATGHPNAIGFVDDGDGNGIDHHHDCRRRDRILSLTDEKILRSEARAAVEDTERKVRDTEKKEAYDDVCPPPYAVRPSQTLLHLGSSEGQLR